MPKREYLIPMDLPKGHDHEAILFGKLQSLDPKQDLERNKQIVVIVGPKEWKRFQDTSKKPKSIQTMRRWLKNLEQLGRVTVERISKEHHRVTVHYYPVEKGHRYGTTKETQGQSRSSQQ